MCGRFLGVIQKLGHSLIRLLEEDDMKKISLIAFAFLLVICPVLMQAKSHRSQRDYGNKICKKEGLSKIFAEPDQIVVKEDGIFVRTSKNKLVRGKFIGVEKGKVYVAVSKTKLIPKRGPCGLHKVYHRKPSGCGGCSVYFCPMNCTCFD